MPKVMKIKIVFNRRFRKSGFGFQVFDFKILPLLILFGVFSEVAMSQTLEDYLIIAAENNPGLKASYARFQAADARISQPGLPDPEMQIGVFLQPMERYMGNQTADYRIMQMFPWFGSIKTQKEEAKYMAQAQYQLFEENKNQLFYQVKVTWYELARLREEKELMRSNLEYLKKLEELSLVRFQGAANPSNSSGTNQPMESIISTTAGASSGNVMGGMNATSTSKTPTSSMSPSNSSSMGSASSGMVDVLEIRLEIKELENQLEILEANETAFQIKFNQILSREKDSPISIETKLTPVTLDWEIKAILDSIQRNNPMLAMYEQEALAYEQKARMAKLDGNPMIGLGVNYVPFLPRENDGIDHSEHSMDMLMPMFTMTLPIFRNKTEAKIKEANFLQESALYNKKQTENLLAMEWANAYRDWQEASKNLALYNQQIDLVKQQVNLLTTAFQAGTSSYSDILRAKQRILSYEIKRLAALTIQHQSLAQLEALAGISLSK